MPYFDAVGSLHNPSQTIDVIEDHSTIIGPHHEQVLTVCSLSHATPRKRVLCSMPEERYMFCVVTPTLVISKGISQLSSALSAAHS